MIEMIAEKLWAPGLPGESLWIGRVGHASLVISFISSLFAASCWAWSEYCRNNTDRQQWKQIARNAFYIHFASVLLTFCMLFVMILNHRFEYHYAWRHSSHALPMEYIISSFWEGQEGSFLLWEFWIAFMGLWVIRRGDELEQPVMSIVSLTQTFLGSMVLGVYVLGYKVGSNPFVLLRHEMADAPIFAQPDYLQFIQDGNGLNPLLQNYWMTIHPPVLFSGFAACLFPYAYAMAALLRGEYKQFITPVIRWSLMAVITLGTGILMGGAWAYESLSFGGFWAWDPVENMSFVPWLLVVGGLHLLLIYRNTGHSLTSALLFLILGFGTVLYSTFLTRSGILGDTSVHAFTDLGMQGQLLIYLGFFVVPALILLTIRSFQLPKIEKEEPLRSREFWMFLGSLLLMLSALQMTFSTSLPVWNKLFGLNLAPPEDAVQHYNHFQIWIAIPVALLTACVQYFGYKQEKFLPNLRWFNLALLLSVVAGVLTSLAWDIPFLQQHKIDLTRWHADALIKVPFLSSLFLFTVTSWLALLGNLFYLVKVLRGRVPAGGGSLAHIGFGIFLLGVIISQGRREVISVNRSGLDFGEPFQPDEKMANVFLPKDSAVKMGDYMVTYTGRKEEKPNTLYAVTYRAAGEEFTLYPNAQVNPKMGLLANPDTKHYLTRDIFTHVTSVPDHSALKDTSVTHVVSAGDTIYTNQHLMVFTGLRQEPPVGDELRVQAVLGLYTPEQKVAELNPVFSVNTADGAIQFEDAEYADASLRVRLRMIDPDSKQVTLEVTQREQAADFVILKAIVFPYINLVWLGGILCFAGSFIAWRARAARVVGV